MRISAEKISARKYLGWKNFAEFFSHDIFIIVTLLKQASKNPIVMHLKQLWNKQVVCYLDAEEKNVERFQQSISSFKFYLRPGDAYFWVDDYNISLNGVFLFVEISQDPMDFVGQDVGMGLTSNTIPSRDIWDKFSSFQQNYIFLASLGKFGNFVKTLGKFTSDIPPWHGITRFSL